MSSTGLQNTKILPIFQTETIAASGSATSESQNLSRSIGYQSLQYEVTGSGTVSFTFQVSNDGVTFSTPPDAVAIISGITAGTGLAPIELTTIARYMKIIATETGGADSVTVSCWLTIQ